MCYGDSILKTCPHCSSTDQIFEYHGCYSGSSPTKTWWILPCAIIEEVPLTGLCDNCSRCIHWLESLDADTSPSLPLSSSANLPILLSGDAECPELDGEADVSPIASMTALSSCSGFLYTSELHLRLICEWYDDIETSLLSLKKSFPRMGARCIATKTADLVVKHGILEAEVEVTLTDALKKLKYVIETNTWIRQVTDDESKIRAVDPEELRAAMFEMRMSCFGLLDDEEMSAEAITKRLRDSAFEVYDALEAAEEEIGKKTEVSGRLKVSDETGKKTSMSRVWSLILG